MKKKILGILLCVVMIAGLTGCGTEYSETEKMISKAEILNWDKILEETNGNAALAEDYENRLYVFMGYVQEIDVDLCNVSGMIVELEKEELKKLNKGDTIVVIGTLKDATTKPKLENAIRLDKKTVEDNYLIALVKKRISGDRMSVIQEYKYSDYTFDKNTYLVNSYKEIDTTYTDREAKTYKLKYDEKGNIIESGNQSEVHTYLYNEDNTILKEIYKMGEFTHVYDYTYEKDKNDHIIKKIKKDENNKNTFYSYEYDDNDRAIRETVESSPDKWDYKLEYNNNGQLVKKSWKHNESSLDNTLEYDYDEFGNITKEVETNDRMTNETYGLLIHHDKKTTNYYYGIVDKK